MDNELDAEYGKHLQNLSVLAHNLRFNNNYIASLMFEKEQRDFAVDILENAMAYMHFLYFGERCDYEKEGNCDDVTLVHNKSIE